LWLTFHLRNDTRSLGWRKLASAVVMGAAIPVMHYTGMAAVTFRSMLTPVDLTHSVQISSVGTVGIGGVALLTVFLLTLLIPLIEGRTLGWPDWTFVCFVAVIPLLAALWLWERQVEQRGHIPLFPPRVVGTSAFASGATFGLVYFAAFTSIFFILAVTWQEGFGHGALASGLVISPFACGAVISARKCHQLAARLGRRVLILGCSTVTVGLAIVLLIFHLTSEPSAWYLVGPLFLAGLGHGIIIAPNIDLVLKSVPPADNGSASGVLNTAQRVGSAFGIAVVGAVLFGTLHPAGHQSLAAAFSHSFQAAIAVNIGLMLLAMLSLNSWQSFLMMATPKPGLRSLSKLKQKPYQRRRNQRKSPLYKSQEAKM